MDTPISRMHLGGSADVPLAYTGEPVHTVPNPFLVPPLRGGKNVNGADPTLPNTGPMYKAEGTIYNNASQQRGGCGTCSMGFKVGGRRRRRVSKCRSRRSKRRGCRSMRKRRSHRGGGSSYPNGLVGQAWNPAKPADWPGVDGVSGNRNYSALNNYDNDVSRQMTDVGANRPFLKGGRTRGKRGGSNFLSQDLVNVGRQVQFGVGSAYNALLGYSAPVNPLPWKDQYTAKIF